MSLQFIADLHRVSSRLSALESRTPHRLPIADVFALAILCDDAIFTVAQLQSRLTFAPSTVSSILNRLERRGFVQRESSVQDRRTFHVTLTVEGRPAALAARAFLESLEDKMTTQLSYAHVIAFSEVIEALDHALRPDPPAAKTAVAGA